MMHLRTLALVALMLPRLAHAEDVVSLSHDVNTLARTDPGAAARLAAAGAARTDLDTQTRVLLGGLAYANFKLSFEAAQGEDKLAELCGLRAVMRLVAPLDAEEAGKLKIAAAEAAEAQLKQAVGDGWPHVCEPPPVHVEAPTGAAQLQPQPKPEPPPWAPAPRPRPRHLKAGVATLASGLALFAPVAGVLVYRHQGENDLANLIAVVGDNEGTDAQQQLAESLRQRYRGTTAAAAVLGTAAVALVVTGAVLLATGRERRSRVAVAPWGARGVGGLVFEGRF
jgi:hypothetical protein